MVNYSKWIISSTERLIQKYEDKIKKHSIFQVLNPLLNYSGSSTADNEELENIFLTWWINYLGNF